MKHSCKRLVSLFCATITVVSGCLMGAALPSVAQEESFAQKWVIHNDGDNGTTVSRSAGTHMEWSKRGFGLKLPASLPLNKLGLYIRVTLDAAAAEAMNKGGSIELAQETYDKSEMNIGIQTVKWKVGLNEVVIPIGEQGGYSDGGQARFDMYKPINWFRFYTTPGSADLTKDSTITIWEVAVVDSTMIGIEFGNDDVYFQLSEPLNGMPNTIEASVKSTQTTKEWSLGLPGAARYDAAITTGTSGTTTAEDEASFGVPSGTSWVGATVHKGGFYGTKDQKLGPVSIPSAYGLEDLALEFWLYTSEPSETLPLCSYIELTSSGKCDVDELEWATKSNAFSDLKVGWNRIVLPFTAASKRGEINLSSLNFVRIWGSQSEQHLAQKEIDFRVSEMRVIVLEESAEEEQESSVEIVDGLPTWQLLDFTKMPRNWDGGKMSVGLVWENDGTTALQPADGTSYMEVTPAKTLTFDDGTANAGLDYWKGGFTASVTDGLVEPHIPSQYTVDDLVFTFWIYVPKAELVPTNQSDSPNFEFTSDGNEDGAQLEKRFLFRDAGGLKDGWNYIEVPLSAMSASGGFDLYNINYLRWSYMCTLKDSTGTVDECVRYADFRIKATVNKGIEDTAENDRDTVDVDPNTVYNIFSNVGGDAKQTVALYLTADGFVGWTWGEKSYVSSFNAFSGEWIDLALVRDMSKGNFLLYADGALVDQKDATGTQDIKPTTAHSIAADSKGDGRFSGWLGDVRVWSDARTAEEIKNNRTPKRGASANGFDDKTQGLIGSWILIGSTQNILTAQPDVSAAHNDALVRSARAAQWEDYVIPTDVIGEDYYTIVFIPDTQELVTGRFTEEWLASAQWIADNVEAENIVHVIGAGDNTWTDTPAQWEVVRRGFDLFTDKVSWSNMTGNHDYPGSCLSVNDTTYTLRDTTNYNTYFGIDYIAETRGFDHYEGSFEDPYGISGVENSYYRFEINGVKWMILQLEYHPRVHVIEWADSILKQYPDDNVIVTTHGYIGNDNAAYCTHWMPYTKQDATIGGYIGELMPSSSAAWPNGSEQPIWTELIYPNDNVKMLLCGHASTADGHVLTRWDKNAAGNTVPQVMINAQDMDVSYFANEAMGMLGILRFSADGSRCEIQYYSPYHGSSYHPSNQEMRSLTLAVNTPAADVPSEPDTPVDPETPTDPETPVEPEIPTDPETPVEPETPVDPEQPVAKKNTLAWVCAGAAVVVVAAVGALVAVMKKKKK